MTRDDWARGIQAEAEHAPDAVWAREARLHAQRATMSCGLGLGITVFGVLAALQIGLLMVEAPNRSLHWSWLVASCAVASAGTFLSRMGISAGHVVLSAMLYVPLSWACLVMAQWLWAEFAPQTPQPFVGLGVGVAMLAVNALGAAKVWKSGKERLA
ncbi:hypothetical protein [Deinococcus irradiatisoli]|nr:hypothetical protein [Deinococcus irradiatisoli]